MKRKLAIGVLILATWIGLLYVAATTVKWKVPVDLPMMTVYSVPGHVGASGTWTIEGNKQAFPLQTTTIECIQSTGICTSATAEVGMGDQLFINLQAFEITSWTDDSVVFTDSAPLCVYYIHTINPRIQSVTAIRKKLPPEKQQGDCAGLEDELRLTMTGGFDVVRLLEKEAQPWFAGLVFAPLKWITRLFD